LGCEVWLKCENLQTTGSFKLRGASNAVRRLREQGILEDVATHSSGNHGAALALAAQRDHRRAYVVIPEDAVPAKIEAVRRYGGEAVLCRPGQAAREQGLCELVAQGLVPVPPYDHPDIIAGQGTAAMELLEEVAALDTLLTPLGGGGLLSGSAIAARAMRPSLRVFGAEPAGAADAHESLRRGERVRHWQPETLADGLRAIVGELNFAIIRTTVDEVLLVSEPAIVEAMRLIRRTVGMSIEPSSAAAIAALVEHPGRFAGSRTGVIVTGGNVDRARFPWLDGAADG